MVTYHYCSSCGQQFPEDGIYSVDGNLVCHGCYNASAQPAVAQPAVLAYQPARVTRRAPEYRWLKAASRWFTAIGTVFMVFAGIAVAFGLYFCLSAKAGFIAGAIAFGGALQLFFYGAVLFVLGEAIVALRDIARNSFRIG